MFLQNYSNALVLDPHTDDGEFGCGGTISKLISSGLSVHYVAFSVCEQSVPYGFSQYELEKELYDATKYLGFDSSYVHALRYPV